MSRLARWVVAAFGAGCLAAPGAARAGDAAPPRVPTGSSIGRPEERPAFFGFIYGVMLPVPVPSDAPPMFVALALDDPLIQKQGFGVVEAWRKANQTVELHAYERGGHGFGVGRPGTTTTQVLGEFITWMDANGWLRQGRKP
ncbi:alpha/beta hydrolase [Tautonia plasticadhaerens]|uniref:Acetylxylan esterase n=1 Tax=Tautonia plasticadhaerens TaxID=2527974 RepID=A0A518HAB2_9BACT|nr:hypothetical protein [Tautonia plasticadhaerens]QDV37783.1 hypothetical protein ElP_57290 [Tautonia plasticadhaerens]